jgi:uncharacterized protein YigE (DUF2233 family)
VKFAAARRILQSLAAVYDRRGLYAAVAALAAFMCGQANAADTAPPGLPTVTFHGVAYTVHEVDPKKDDLQMFLKFSNGVYIHDFTGLQTYLDGKGEKLLFAANGGMFQPDFSPCGLLVENGTEISPLNTNDGQGNFYMKPNGVFLINQKHEARVVSAANYADELTPAVWATQSGPMLVLRGDINPDFNASSKNVNIRSGVGVRKDGVAVFAISQKPVNFYDFASLFADKLKCSNALFLDGTISAFYYPGLKEKGPRGFGPMIGVVSKAP